MVFFFFFFFQAEDGIRDLTVTGVQTCALPISQGEWLLAGALYVIATAGFMGANVFYDAMLTEIAPPRAYERASALGYSFRSEERRVGKECRSWWSPYP